MKTFEAYHIQKYFLIDNKKLRIAEIIISATIFVLLMVVAGLTNILFRQEYAVGSPIISIDNNFAMEGKLNNELYQAAPADFLFQPSADWIFLPKR